VVDNDRDRKRNEGLKTTETSRETTEVDNDRDSKRNEWLTTIEIERETRG
jgi:hypothetical protein